MPKSSIYSPAQQHELTPEQSRAARGWLGWSQEDLAKQANVALRTVASFERGEITPRPNNMAAIRRVLEAAGISLLFDDDGVAAGIFHGNARGNKFTDLGEPRRVSHSRK